MNVSVNTKSPSFHLSFFRGEEEEPIPEGKRSGAYELCRQIIEEAPGTLQFGEKITLSKYGVQLPNGESAPNLFEKGSDILTFLNEPEEEPEGYYAYFSQKISNSIPYWNNTTLHIIQNENHLPDQHQKYRLEGFQSVLEPFLEEEKTARLTSLKEIIQDNEIYDPFMKICLLSTHLHFLSFKEDVNNLQDILDLFKKINFFRNMLEKPLPNESQAFLDKLIDWSLSRKKGSESYSFPEGAALHQEIFYYIIAPVIPVMRTKDFTPLDSLWEDTTLFSLIADFAIECRTVYEEKPRRDDPSFFLKVDACFLALSVELNASLELSDYEKNYSLFLSLLAAAKHKLNKEIALQVAASAAEDEEQLTEYHLHFPQKVFINDHNLDRFLAFVNSCGEIKHHLNNIEELLQELQTTLQILTWQDSWTKDYAILFQILQELLSLPAELDSREEPLFFSLLSKIFSRSIFTESRKIVAHLFQKATVFGVEVEKKELHTLQLSTGIINLTKQIRTIRHQIENKIKALIKEIDEMELIDNEDPPAPLDDTHTKKMLRKYLFLALSMKRT